MRPDAGSGSIELVRPGSLLSCDALPCVDVEHAAFTVPDVEIDARRIRVVMVSEAAPAHVEDWFYAGPDALFAETTVAAFNDAGEDVSSVSEILDLGVYLTTAVKCGKTGYAIATETVTRCSHLLEIELAQFPSARALMLMGDVAIKAVNAIARRNGEQRVVPAGATYELRGGDYRFRGMKVFPSYVQAGPSFYIEKRKREMIAEDIAGALAYVRAGG